MAWNNATLQFPRALKRWSPRLVIVLVAIAAQSVRQPSAPGADSVKPGRQTPTPAERAVDHSINRGFAWLIRAIHRNGSVSTDEYGEPDLACTAITGLALLAEGSTPRCGHYSRDCERVLYAVLDLSRRRLNSDKASTLVRRKIGRNADLFFATLFLSEAYGESPHDHEQIREVLRLLIDRICQAQGADGTWGEESWAPILGTVMGWECLRSAHSAGFRVDASAQLVAKALQRKLIETAQTSRENSWMHDFYKETASLRVLYSTPYRKDPIFDQTVERLLRTARTERRTFESAGGEEYLAFYLVSECLQKEPRPSWAAWQPLVWTGY